jgi:hypothetical protein
MKCLKDGAKNAVSADVYRDRKASLKKLAEAALGGSCPDGPSYFCLKGMVCKVHPSLNFQSWFCTVICTV